MYNAVCSLLDFYKTHGDSNSSQTQELAAEVTRYMSNSKYLIGFLRADVFRLLNTFCKIQHLKYLSLSQTYKRFIPEPAFLEKSPLK